MLHTLAQGTGFCPKVSLHAEVGYDTIFDGLKEFLHKNSFVICTLFSALFVQSVNLLNKFSEHLNIT